MSEFKKLSARDFKSAFVSFVLTVVLAGAVYVVGIGDIFAIELHAFINVIAMAGLVFIISLIKSWATTKQGDFLGAVKIK